MRYSKLYEIVVKDVVVQTPDGLTPDEISHLKPYKVNDNASLAQKFQLTVGSRVMLIRNIAVHKGLVNGGQGFVTDVEFGAHRNFPSAVYVAFDNYKIGASLQRLEMAVNIDRKTYNHNLKSLSIDVQFYGKFDIYLQRTQFPLTLSWATTVHEVQGITLDCAVLDIGATVFESGMTCVALSRVWSIHGLALINFEKRKKQTSSKCQNEMVRLQSKAKENCSDPNQPFTKLQRLRQEREVPQPKATAEIEAKKAVNSLTIQKYDIDFQTSLIDENCIVRCISVAFLIISVISRQFDMI